MSLTVGSARDLVVVAAEPCSFGEPSLLAVRSYLRWCFHLLLEMVALDVVGLWRQMLALFDRVHLALKCFSSGVSMPDCLCG